MFTQSQLKNWPSGHLQSGAWYLDCSGGFTPDSEASLFQSIKDNPTAEPEFDEFAGLDDDAQAKALKRREFSDKKKEERWEEARKKQEENEAKRKERIAEKGKADA